MITVTPHPPFILPLPWSAVSRLQCKTTCSNTNCHRRLPLNWFPMTCRQGISTSCMAPKTYFSRHFFFLENVGVDKGPYRTSQGLGLNCYFQIIRRPLVSLCSVHLFWKCDWEINSSVTISVLAMVSLSLNPTDIKDRAGEKLLLPQAKTYL